VEFGQGVAEGTSAEDAAMTISSTAARAADLYSNLPATGGQNAFTQRAQNRTTLLQNATQQGNTQSVWLRPVFRVPANYRVSAAPPVIELSSRVQRALDRASLSGLAVQVTMDGSTAVLRGEVPSERDRTFVATTVRLEPGVKLIQNELQIVESLAPPSPSDTSQTVPPVLEEVLQFDEELSLLD
jgi:hypothetical protein